jgi:putative membrane protein
MRFIIRFLLSGLAVFMVANILPGVDVKDYWSAVLVALLISLLNNTVKPVLVFFTLPVTLLTLGLFMFVINSCIILMVDYFMDSFYVKNFWWALLFSIIMSLINSILQKLLKKDKEKKTRLYDQYGKEIE